PEPRLDRRHHVGGLLRLAQVGGHAGYLDAVGQQRVARRVQVRRVARRDRHARALEREGAGAREADALAPPGDQDDAALQPQIHRNPLQWLGASSQSKRHTAISPNTALKRSIMPIGAQAASRPSPRQVIASSPSTAQRVGTASDTVCSHWGKMKDGTQAPPSITMMSVTKMASPRVASGVLPSAAISSPKLAVSSENAIVTPMKPITLPSMRTPKTAIAVAKMRLMSTIAVSAPLAMRLPNSSERDTGAARKRFHIPMRRASSRPTPSSMPLNRMNCTP